MSPVQIHNSSSTTAFQRGTFELQPSSVGKSNRWHVKALISFLAKAFFMLDLILTQKRLACSLFWLRRNCYVPRRKKGTELDTFCSKWEKLGIEEEGRTYSLLEEMIASHLALFFVLEDKNRILALASNASTNEWIQYFMCSRILLFPLFWIRFSFFIIWLKRRKGGGGAIGPVSQC